MYKNSNPRIIAVIATAIIFLLFLLAGCKSKQQVVTEYRCSDSLEVKEVAAVRSTAKATSSTSSLEQMLSSMSLNIDSIVITMPSQLSNEDIDDDSLTGETAILPASYHDLASSVVVSRSPGDCLLRSEPRLTSKSVSDLASHNSSSPHNTCIPKSGKIVISGISLNSQSSKAKANITASSDTVSEVRSAETELTSHTSQSVQRTEGKPRNKCKFHYYVIAMAVIASALCLMKKFHIFNLITRVIKKIFS